jgi:hypothetical protein
MFRLTAIENDSVQIYPSMRLKTIRFLPRPNAQAGIHTAAPQHTAKSERPFEAARVKKEIRGGHRLKVRDSSRDVQSVRLRNLRIPCDDSLPLERRLANPEAKKAHCEPGERQRGRSFEHNPTLESTQPPKSAPPLHHRFNP